MSSRTSETLELVPLEPTLNVRGNVVKALPPLPSLARLLTEPLTDIRDFGALPTVGEDSLRIRKGYKNPAAQLSELLKELVPMIDSFRTPASRRVYWWQRFTGAALERDLTYRYACSQLESTANRANALAAAVAIQRGGLNDEFVLAQDQCKWMERVVTLGRTALEDTHANARAAPAFSGVYDYWPRFARRVENLDVLHHSMLLSVEQIKLTDALANTVLDRFAEVLTTLMPLWRQRMGFELFLTAVQGDRAQGK